jgi:hypothetical protein
LNLVEKHRWAKVVEEAARVRTGAKLEVGIFQEEILRTGEGVAQKKRLPGTPGTCNDDGRKVSSGLENDGLNGPPDNLHIENYKLSL